MAAPVMRSVSWNENCIIRSTILSFFVFACFGGSDYIELVNQMGIQMYASQLSIDDIRRDLRSFLKRIETGERVVITKGGKVLAEVKPLAVPMSTGRPFGLGEGDFTVPDDFDAPLPKEVLEGFEGK